MPPSNEHYFRLLQDQNNELEEMCSIQAQEMEKLQAEVSALKKKLARTKRAGARLNTFVDGLICADLLHDEVWDEANKVCENWEEKR